MAGSTGQCNTLADFPPDKYMLLVYCCDCRRRPELNRSALAADTRIETLRPRLVCSVCGSRSTQLDIVWHGGGGSRYSTWGAVRQ
jgi:hypothetical protein